MWGRIQVMQPETHTSTRLLDGLKDEQDQAIWGEFDARYRPIVEGFVRHLGLRDADAADAAQETMVRFIQEYRAGKYDREKGRLRSWLIGIARYRVLDMQRKRGGRREVAGDSMIGDQADEARLSAIWDEESRMAVLRRAVGELRRRTKMDPKTIRAFELIALERRDANSVAEELGMKPADVYIAKHRALDKLQSIVAELTELYELGPG